MNVTLTAVTALSIKSLENQELAAANLGLTGFGYLAPENFGYRPLVERELLREDGYPHDAESLLAALNHEIKRRMNEGLFV